MTAPPPLTETGLAELRDLRATPCPGCTCADSEHRYCQICADRIQDLEKRVGR